MDEPKGGVGTAMPEARDLNWLSAHVYADHRMYTESFDCFLLRDVLPRVQRIRRLRGVHSYFFVRYTDTAPHVRLRFRSSRAAVRDAIDDVLTEIGTEVRWVPYVPELNRYGGMTGVGIAEWHFEHSSDLALRVLDSLFSSASDHSGKLGRAMIAMICLTQAFARTRQASIWFLDQYATGYLMRLAACDSDIQSWEAHFDTAFEPQTARVGSYVAQAWARFTSGEPAAEWLDPVRRHFRNARITLHDAMTAGRLVKDERAFAHWAEVLRTVVSSYLHMLNNRLGVSIPEEAYLARAASDALTEVADK